MKRIVELLGRLEIMLVVVALITYLLYQGAKLICDPNCAFQGNVETIEPSITGSPPSTASANSDASK